MEASLDDFNLHSADEEGLLEHLRQFVSICQERRLFPSALKCNLFPKEIK